MVQNRPVRDDEDLPEPPQVRRLRLLVSVLTVVLIGGMLVVTVTMVLRLGLINRPETRPVSAAPVSAAELALPQDAEVISLGRGPGEILVLTRDPSGAESLRIFDAATGAQRSATAITRE